MFQKKIFCFHCGWLAMSLLLTSCGGGGGGPSVGTSHGNTPLLYAGLTTQAPVSTGNAEVLATGAVLGQETGAAFGFQLTDTGPDKEEGTPRLHELAGIFLHIAASDVVEEPLSSPTAALVTTAEPVTMPGSCGGDIVTNLLLDSQTGTFSGSMTFRNYCESGGTMDGQTEVMGQFNQVDGTLQSISAGFNRLSFNDGTNAYTMSGQIDVLEAGSTNHETVVTNINLRESGTATVYRYEDYREDIIIGAGFTSETISGRFYHPSYGYVELTTLQSLHFDAGAEWPSSGVLQCSGGNNTAVRMSFASSSHHLEADTDGDGVYDWQNDFQNGLMQSSGVGAVGAVNDDDNIASGQGH